MKPFQHVAVGYDGSPDATNAVRWTFDAAREVHSSVTIVHAIGLIEHQRKHFSTDRVPPALLALAKECAFEESELHWLVEDGDACSVLLRMTSPPINADMLVVVHGAKENVKDFFWVARASNSPSTQVCRSL